MILFKGQSVILYKNLLKLIPSIYSNIFLKKNFFRGEGRGGIVPQVKGYLRPCFEGGRQDSCLVTLTTI